MSKVNLAVNIGGLEMKNPVTTASGTFGSGLEMVEYVDLSRLGAVTIKGTTLEPRPGNPQPRIAETPAGMLNSIGLENPGVEVICRDVLPKVAEYKSPIIVNIAGREIEDYGKVAAILEKDDNCAAIEVNVSCPNVKNGGMALGTNPDLIYETTKLVKENTTKPVIIKLSPNVTNIVEMAQAAERGGADALTLINCLLGTAIDIKTRKPIIANVVAGLSGPAIKPVALRMVYQVSQAVNLPIIGLGGIICWEDAVEFLLAGATGVSVGTGNFVDPSLTMKVIDGIEQYLIDNGFDDVNDIIGLAWRK
ncbi:MAG: dihydroorotate dehydrogenase [Firmicutes bacterium]|nr:dihydroorotate dehydrogenase [Bacillota bacterium]